MVKILIVDDELFVRDMMADMIKPAGYDVIVAENGAEAFDVCKKESIDLIITDIVMPEKNGIDLIMNVKKEYPEIPIIAVSGGGGITGRYDYLEIAKLVGANNILKKPFKIEELRTAVSDAIENKTMSN